MKKLILLIVILVSSISFAQQRVGIQVTQDGKLAVLGDKEHGLSTGTLDVAIKIMMQGQQREYGYMVVYPEFEYADLTIVAYRRWSANAGYIFNHFRQDKKLEIGASIGWGFIDRSLTDWSWGSNLFVHYKIKKNFKVIMSGQLTERSDLAILYGKKFENEWRTSLRFGVQIDIFDSYSR